MVERRWVSNTYWGTRYCLEEKFSFVKIGKDKSLCDWKISVSGVIITCNLSSIQTRSNSVDLPTSNAKEIVIEVESKSTSGIRQRLGNIDLIQSLCGPLLHILPTASFKLMALLHLKKNQPTFCLGRVGRKKNCTNQTTFLSRS